MPPDFPLGALPVDLFGGAFPGAFPLPLPGAFPGALPLVFPVGGALFLPAGEALFPAFPLGALPALDLLPPGLLGRFSSASIRRSSCPIRLRIAVTSALVAASASGLHALIGVLKANKTKIEPRNRTQASEGRFVCRWTLTDSVPSRGHPEGETAPSARLGLQLNPPAVGASDGLNDGEPEPTSTFLASVVVG